LLDERALLTCMAYVDLNPVRAKMAEGVEKSEYTSIFERIHGASCHKEMPCSDYIGKPLFGFVAGEFNDQPQGIPYALLDYIELVDWTGRVVRDDKRGAVSERLPSLLSTLGIDNETWLDLSGNFGRDYHGAVGSLKELALFAEHTGKRWISGKTKLQRMLH